MKIEQIAVQLYTLRNSCDTAASYAATLKNLRAIGYQAVELAGKPAIAESEVVSIANGEGITICGAHVGAAKVLNEPDQIVDYLSALGCRYTACSFPAGVDASKEEDVETMVRQLDAAGEVLRKAGKVFAYHNHANEFVQFCGKPLLETIYARTQPKNVKAELDTYWAQLGGVNPVEWCSKLNNRLPLLHLKDYAVDASGKPFFTEIGAGNLSFKPIIAAAEASGCEWFIVEQDTCPGDPLDSVKKSFDYIQANLVG